MISKFLYDVLLGVPLTLGKEILEQERRGELTRPKSGAGKPAPAG